MAKTIKSIICPQCGSNKIETLEKDYFQCNSCHTNFFLDTDDITITHKHIYGGGHMPSRQDRGKLGKYIAISVLILLVLSLVISLFSSNKGSKEQNHSTIKESEKNKIYTPTTFGKGLVELSTDKLAFVTLVYFSDFEAKNMVDEVFLYVVDAKTGKELKRAKQAVDISKKGAGVSKNWVEIESFLDADNRLYFIVNKYFVYIFDRESMELEDITSSFFKGYKEFDSGVASVSISYRNFIYLSVIDNKGIKYAFVPDIKTVVLEQEWTKLPELILPQPEVKTFYRFTMKSKLPTIAEEPIQLIQFKQKVQKGYPMYDAYYVNSKDYLIGEFKDRKNYNTDIVANYKEKSDRIVSFKDFTPNNFYREGGIVLAEDTEGVIVAIKTTKDNTDEPYKIQKLKHADGSVIWTVETQWLRGIAKLNQVNDKYFAFMINKEQIIVMNMVGEQVTTIKMKYTID